MVLRVDLILVKMSNGNRGDLSLAMRSKGVIYIHVLRCDMT